MKDIVKKALEEQMNKEFFSAYLYLHLSNCLNEQSLDGFSHWLRLQAQEELDHAIRILDYLLERDAGVTLAKIDAPLPACPTAKVAFEEAYAHEQFITRSINEVLELAQKEGDHATAVFLHWFVTEQVEEEDTTRAIVGKLDLIGDNIGLLFALDKELGARS
ncbi:MAG: ferritin [Christensenellales bacterium]|jgi:ferritin